MAWFMTFNFYKVYLKGARVSFYPVVFAEHGTKNIEHWIRLEYGNTCCFWN